MTMGMQALSGLGLVYIILIFCRCILKWGDGSCGTDKRPGIGIAQTTGSRQVQADVAQIWDSSAGLMAVIADGIGSANTGKVCAQVAADAILDRYEPYCELNDPDIFFQDIVSGGKPAYPENDRRAQRRCQHRRSVYKSQPPVLCGGRRYPCRSHAGRGDDSAEQGADAGCSGGAGL